jgi:hypothetical protein
MVRPYPSLRRKRCRSRRLLPRVGMLKCQAATDER